MSLCFSEVAAAARDVAVSVFGDTGDFVSDRGGHVQVVGEQEEEGSF